MKRMHDREYLLELIKENSGGSEKPIELGLAYNGRGQTIETIWNKLQELGYTWNENIFIKPYIDNDMKFYFYAQGVGPSSNPLYFIYKIVSNIIANQGYQAYYYIDTQDTSNYVSGYSMKSINLNNISEFDAAIPTDCRLVEDQGKLQLQMEHDSQVLSIDTDFDATLRSNLIKTITNTGTFTSGDVNTRYNNVGTIKNSETLIGFSIYVNAGPAQFVVTIPIIYQQLMYQLSLPRVFYNTTATSMSGVPFPAMRFEIGSYTSTLGPSQEFYCNVSLPDGNSFGYDMNLTFRLHYL